MSTSLEYARARVATDTDEVKRDGQSADSDAPLGTPVPGCPTHAEREQVTYKTVVVRYIPSSAVPGTSPR